MAVNPDPRNKPGAARDGRLPKAPQEYAPPDTHVTHRHVSEAVTHLYESFVEHVDAVIEKQNRLFASGFPDADPAKHRLNHETESRDADAWRKLKWDLASKTFYGLLVVIGLFFWNGGLAAIKLWLK
ncbi:MAG: hypothetical protein H7232_02295 [Aeromicrobium sp.]|nr:hypothetical protein [Burkholderiales bacterium]